MYFHQRSRIRDISIQHSNHLTYNLEGNSFFNKVVNEAVENSKEWKKSDDVQRRLQFCAAYGKFYNKVSVIIDPHRDALKLPSSCSVGSIDFKKYVAAISKGSPSLKVVGSALIKLAAEGELPEETTV